MLQAYVDGYYPSGSPAHLAMSISTMQSLFGGGRSNWFDVVPPGGGLPPTAGGSLVGSTATSRQAFWTSPDGHVTFREWTPSSGWQPVLDLGAPVTGHVVWDPSAATPGGGHLDLAVRDSGVAPRHPVVLRHLRLDGVAHHCTGDGLQPGSGRSDSRRTGPLLPRGGQQALPRRLDAGRGLVGRRSASRHQQRRLRPGRGGDRRRIHPPVRHLPGHGRQLVANQLLAVHRLGYAGSGKPGPRDTGADGRARPRTRWNGATNPSVYYTGTDGVVYHCAYTVSAGTWSVWYAVPGTGVTSSPAVWNADSGVTVFAQYQAAMATQGWDATGGWRVWMPI